MRRALAAVLLVVCIAVAGAQSDSSTQSADTSIGIIVYAEGSDIEILRNGSQRRLDVGLGEAFGEPLYAGDQLSTGEGTHAEIQLLTSSNVVKMAENTTFRIDELETGADTTLTVTYGRVRAKVGALLGNARFRFRGYTAVAGVRGTDFGYDQVLDPATGELVNRVYCFGGEVLVESASEPGRRGTITTGQMVAAESDAPTEEVAVEPIAEPVVSFWVDRPFVREPATVPELRAEFPDLVRRVRTDLGVLPAELREDPVDPSADPAIEPPTVAEPEAGPERDAPLVTEVPSDSRGRAEEDDARDRPAGGNALRTTGVVLASLGVVTDLAAVGLFYFGEDFIPGWNAENNEMLGPIAAAGVGVVAGGIIMILISHATGE
ncbi:MAG: FecR domain-containing protein [Spirochaetota bacterium]